MDSCGQSGVLVLLGVLFTIILAGLDNTIVSTVITFAAYMLAVVPTIEFTAPSRLIVGQQLYRLTAVS